MPDLTRGVAARLAALCLDADGRPADHFAPSDAVRCGLLVDLALAGRLVSTDDSIEIVGDPVGFGPADALLGAMTAEPDRSLDTWFDERRIGLDAVVGALVAAGRWTGTRTPVLRRHRYRVVDDDQRTGDLAIDVDGATAGWLADDAAVAALGHCAYLLGEARADNDRFGQSIDPSEVSEAVLAASDPVRWMVSSAVEHLTWSRHRDQVLASALNAGGTIGPG